MSSNPYDMGKPTEIDLVAALDRVMGPIKAQQIMAEARDFCGEPESGEAIPFLTRMVLYLCKRKGVASVVGRSMMIRIKFHDSIYRKYDYV